MKRPSGSDTANDAVIRIVGAVYTIKHDVSYISSICRFLVHGISLTHSTISCEFQLLSVSASDVLTAFNSCLY